MYYAKIVTGMLGHKLFEPLTDKPRPNLIIEAPENDPYKRLMLIKCLITIQI